MHAGYSFPKPTTVRAQMSLKTQTDKTCLFQMCHLDVLSFDYFSITLNVLNISP